jgi:hypothetical protein
MNLDSEQLNNFMKRNENVMFLDCHSAPQQGFTNVVMAWDIDDAIAHGALLDGTGDYMAFVACVKGGAYDTTSAQTYLHKFIVDVCPVEVYKDRYLLWHEFADDIVCNFTMSNDVLREMLIPTTDLGGTA